MADSAAATINIKILIQGQLWPQVPCSENVRVYMYVYGYMCVCVYGCVCVVRVCMDMCTYG